RARHVSQEPVADAGTAGRLLRQGVRQDQAEYGDTRRDSPDPGRRESHGARVRGIPAVEDEAAVRERDRQVRRRAGNRASLEIRQHRLMRVRSVPAVIAAAIALYGTRAVIAAGFELMSVASDGSRANAASTAPAV